MKEKPSHGTEGSITSGNRMGKHGLDSSDSGERQVESSCGLSNEPLEPQNA